MQVAISTIKIPEQQKRINPGNLTETGGLAENIKQYGMLHPILVTKESTKYQVSSTNNSSLFPPPSSFRYVLVAGYRRLKAAESLGWTEVPVTILDSVPDSNNADSLSEYDLHLSENIKRKGLSPIELSEVVLERKYRFEQVYGPIKPGGDQRSKSAQEIKLAACQNGPPDFYEQTSRLLETSIWTIYRLLRLQELDPDLKAKVYSRELNYTTALSEQSNRNLTKKNEKKPGSKPAASLSILPNKETAVRYAELYKQTPKLLQLYQLVYHTWQTTKRLADYEPECDKFDLELLHVFMVQLGEVLTFYNNLFNNLQQSQDKQIEAMIQANIPE
ncbi:MAG: ParB/RepB/Spo0J family partition protein [bacterium]